MEGWVSSNDLQSVGKVIRAEQNIGILQSESDLKFVMETFDLLFPF